MNIIIKSITNPKMNPKKNIIMVVMMNMIINITMNLIINRNMMNSFLTRGIVKPPHTEGHLHIVLKLIHPQDFPA